MSSVPEWFSRYMASRAGIPSGRAVPAKTGEAVTTGPFDGESRDISLAFGTVRGIREWTADLSFNSVTLRGVYGNYWKPGVNEAACGRIDSYGNYHRHRCAAKGCTCGFYAYWNRGGNIITHCPVGVRYVPVAGVIEGWGRTVTGSRGFRCEKAKIL